MTSRDINNPLSYLSNIPFLSPFISLSWLFVWSSHVLLATFPDNHLLSICLTLIWLLVFDVHRFTFTELVFHSCTVFVAAAC